MKRLLPKYIVKLCRKPRIRSILDQYLFYFRRYFSFYKKTTIISTIFSPLFNISLPHRQLNFNLYHSTLGFHRSISTGQIIRWDFLRAKHFKRSPLCFTTICALFWQYFFLFFSNSPYILISNYNYYIFSFLSRLFSILNFTPAHIFILHAHYQPNFVFRRINRKYFKTITLNTVID